MKIVICSCSALIAISLFFTSPVSAQPTQPIPPVFEWRGPIPDRLPPWFDRDGDGLDRADIKELLDQARQSLGLRLRTLFDTLVPKDAAEQLISTYDSNLDGVISPAELIAAIVTLLNALDTNRDGEIQKSEIIWTNVIQPKWVHNVIFWCYDEIMGRRDLLEVINSELYAWTSWWEYEVKRQNQFELLEGDAITDIR